MRRLSLIPNAITAFGLGVGLFALFSSIFYEYTIEHMLHKSAVLLLIAGFADLIDGAVARLLKGESEFGLMFDSLADAVSFGVLPSVLVLRTLGSTVHPFSFYLMVGAVSYSMCGVLRLVRFNVKAQEAKGDLIEESAQKKNFTGCPIPIAALSVFSLNYLLSSDFLSGYIHIEQSVRIAVMASVMILVSYLMVSRWKFPSLKRLNLKVPSFPLIFTAGFVTLLILYGIFHYLPLTMVIVSWSYLLVAFFLNVIRLIAGRKSQVLDDFEAEEEAEE